MILMKKNETFSRTLRPKEAGGSDFKARCFFAGQAELIVSEMSLPSFVKSFENLLSDFSKVWLIFNLGQKIV